ncbi:MAG TPA: antibiotic biosynthesis monooxygenase [Anaerolineales bacterium]
MASMIVQHTVKDYAQWKIGFDSSLSMRKSGGEISAQIYRDSTDPNKLTIVNKWESMDSAHKFALSPELKAGMEKAGVVGMPTFSFVNEA